MEATRCELAGLHAAQCVHRTGGMHGHSRCTLVCALVLVASASPARADFVDGEVPAGVNAFVQRRHDLRLSVLGASALGITDHTELSSFLLADLVLIPNLRVEHQFINDGTVAMSFTAAAVAGWFPLAGATVLPLPGGAVGGAGIGFAWGTMQSAALIGTVRITPTISLSANAGGFAMEGGVAGIVGGAGIGGNGAAVGATPAAASGARVGVTAGVELSATFGRRDALVIACDGWFFRPPAGLLYARAGWTHQWGRFQLTLGVYGFGDPPRFERVRTSQLPVAPYAGVAWAL